MARNEDWDYDEYGNEIEDNTQAVLAAKTPDYTIENLMFKKVGFFRKETGVVSRYTEERTVRDHAVKLFGAWWRRPYTFAINLSNIDSSVKHYLRWIDDYGNGQAVCGQHVSAGDVAIEFAAFVGDRVPLCGQCDRYDGMFEQSMLNKLRKLSGPTRTKVRVLKTRRKNAR